MVLMLKINTTDSMSIDFLEKVKKHRKMSQVVADAIAHYCRTPEGQKSLEMLENLHKKSKKTVGKKDLVNNVSDKPEAEAGKKTVPKKGTVKQSKSIDDFLS